MFSNFIRFDLKNGLLKAWKKYVIAIFVFSCFFSFHFFRVYAQNIHLQKSGETPLRFTCGDLLLSVLDGMKEFHYEDGEPFLFPALWIFVFLLLLYFTLRYPSENLGGIGKSMLILSQRRKTWYLSKCVWCVSFVLMYFAVLYLTAFLTCICLGGEVTLQPSEYAPAILNAGTYLKAPPWNILPGLFLIPCWPAASLCSKCFSPFSCAPFSAIFFPVFCCSLLLISHLRFFPEIILCSSEPRFFPKMDCLFSLAFAPLFS